MPSELNLLTSREQALTNRVAKLERTVEFLLAQLKLTYVDNPTYPVSPEIVNLIQAGKMIEAIKLYRQETGADLVTAKKYLENLNL